MPYSKSAHEKTLLQSAASIVLAGGQGTRLYPLTANRCKPAVAFGGRYRLIDIPLSNSLNSGIYQIFVISQYFASDLHQHILSTYQLDMFRSGGIELLTPQETTQGKNWFKGTADAIRQNLDYIMQFPFEYFLILSGDQLYNMDLLKMLEWTKKCNADLVIAALPVDEPEAKRMGLLKLDDSLKAQSFFEKPQEKEILQEYQLPQQFLKKHRFDTSDPKWLGSMGIYVFKRSALKQILELEGDDFGRHLIPQYVGKDKSYAFIYDGYWEDIGTVGSYYNANLILTERGKGLNAYDEKNPIYTTPQHIPGALINGTRVKNSIISHGAIIEAEEITHSVIGIRTKIKEGTVIRNSIILGNRAYIPEQFRVNSLLKEFSIGKNCIIQNAIIDENAYIGNDVQLINKNKLQKMDGEGIFIRDGIIVVTSGTVVPDGFIL